VTRRARAMRTERRRASFLLAAVLLAGAGCDPPAGEREDPPVLSDRHGVEEPAAAPLQRPRLVVLYVLDALRADHVGHLGGSAGISPTLDRLAAEGASFRRHWSTGPNTLAAIRNLFTGEVWAHSRSWRAAGATRATLAEAFRAAGYRTGLFSANGYVSARFGLARGFEHVSREALFEEPAPGEPFVNRSAERVHAATLAWLDALAGDEPAFLYLQTIHPHNPYAPPEDLERRFTAGIPSKIRGDTRTLISIQRGRLKPSPADRERLQGLYAASVAQNDRELASLLEALASRFPPAETLVMVTSDHGEELFDHGGVLHGYTLYEELLHVPLIVRWPGTVRPGSIGLPTDALDLHATLLEVAGAPARTPPGPGRSLLPLLAAGGSPLAARPLFAAAPGVSGGIAAIRDGDWKLIRVGGSRRGWVMGTGAGRSRDPEYLFDLTADPGERHNLAGHGGAREERLRARLRAWLEERGRVGAGEPERPEEPLDEETERRLRALGYVD